MIYFFCRGKLHNKLNPQIKFKMSSAIAYTCTKSSSVHMGTNNKFCVICKNAGLAEKEYTNHHIRDTPGPNGKVVCPTLLNSECKFCFKRGHFKSEKYCSAYRRMLSDRFSNREQERSHRQQRQGRTDPVQCIPVMQNKNPYHVLDMDMDITSDDTVTPTPTPTPTTKMPELPNTVKMISYASMLTKHVDDEKKTLQLSSNRGLEPGYKQLGVVAVAYRPSSWLDDEEED